MFGLLLIEWGQCCHLFRLLYEASKKMLMQLLISALSTDWEEEGGELLQLAACRISILRTVDGKLPLQEDSIEGGDCSGFQGSLVRGWHHRSRRRDHVGKIREISAQKPTRTLCSVGASGCPTAEDEFVTIHVGDGNMMILAMIICDKCL